MNQSTPNLQVPLAYVNTPVRIPKLRVRDRLEETGHDLIEPSALPRPNTHAAVHASGSSTTRASASSSTCGIPAPSHSRLNNERHSSSLVTTPLQTARGKSKGFKAFLTLKEPSTAAFEEYANQQRKLAAAKGATGPTFPNVSHQKLPGHVPRVNSKWDGMPHIAHEHGRDSWKRSMDSQPTSQRHSKKSMLTSSKSSGSRGTSSADSSQSQGQSSWQTEFSPQHASLETNITTPPISPANPMFTKSPPKSAATPHDTSRLSISEQPLPISTSPEAIGVGGHVKDPKDVSVVTKPDVHVASISPDQTSNDYSPQTPDDVFPWSPHSPRSQAAPQPTPLNPTRDDAAQPESPIAPTDDEPQWPLPASPGSFVQVPSPETSVPPIPTKSFRRKSTSPLQRPNPSTGSQEPSPAEKTATAYLLPPPKPPSPVSPGGPKPARNFTRPFNSGLNSPPGTSSSSPSPIATPVQAPQPKPFSPVPYLTPNFRQPAGRPGRAIIKDSDLATIPESDTASVLQAAPADEDGDPPAGGSDAVRRSTEAGESSPRASTSSDMSASWYKSPRERLGLGGFIKHDSKDSPWPMGLEEDEDYVLGSDERKSPAPGEKSDRGWRRGKVMGFIRR